MRSDQPRTTLNGFVAWGASDKGSTVSLSNGHATEAEPLYVLCDDERNKFVYVGEDTFTRLPEGAQRDRWLQKVRAGKVSAMEIVGVVTFPVENVQE